LLPSTANGTSKAIIEIIVNRPTFHDWSTSNTEQDALAAMAAVADSLGYFGILLSYSPTGWLPSDEPGAIYRIIQVGANQRLLQDWTALAEDNRLRLTASNRKFDPIRRRMVKQTIPRCFDVQAMMDASPAVLTTTEKRWCKSVLRTGVETVVSVPVQIPPSEYWNLTLLGVAKNGNSETLADDELAGLMYFTHGLVKFCIDQLRWRESGRQDLRISLRPRERDCLYWAARGKSAAVTAEILGLKTETVRKYLKTALARLNARNKAQAVTKALQWGLLELTGDE